MKSSKQKVIQEKDLINQLLVILDSVDYGVYSDGRATHYLEYIKGDWKDEIRLVDPVFFPRFANEILGFFFGTSIIPKEKAGVSGERPDFLPNDLNLHPFIFETKGTDCDDLTTHYPQVKGYLEKTGVQYGILLNIRDVKVFNAASSKHIPDISFSIEKLYRDSKFNPKTIDLQTNTKHFLEFVRQFSHKELNFIKKIETIAEAKPWTGAETLSLDDLTGKIREVVAILHNDVRHQKEYLLDILDYDNNRKEKIAHEIDAIAESIDSKKPELKISPSTLKEMLKTKQGNLDERAVDLYLYRTAYFTMTRILLVRLWEDIGFIDESLYNGGFKKWYDNFNREIEKVLKYAFNLAGERYSWLFKKENNYTWYYPSDNALVDVLYEFSHFNFSKLNADVLGTIYEEYVDRVDRQNKGQYYTPREVVSFIWDLVGFTNDNAFFKFENGFRKPKLIFDPCTGSGGFLVEAARRIREDANYNGNDFKDLSDIENCIINGLYGSEISPFAYYITEINLLIQLTPIIKKILDSQKHLYRHPEFALSVIHQDSLKLHDEPVQLRFGEEEETFKARDQIYEHDKKHDIVNLEGQKRQVYDAIKNCQEFDYVCANPPYIREDDHKDLFRYTVKQYPYWKEYYQGKMDYLYFFIILGLSKLKEGGKLGFITTAYFPSAYGASKLRNYILENAKIEIVIDFGELRVFESAPGQFNHIFVLEKCSDDKKRSENKIITVKTKQPLAGNNSKEILQNTLKHIEKHIEKREFADDYIEVRYSPLLQGKLTKDSWTLYPSIDAHLILLKIEKIGMPLKDVCDAPQGLVSGADTVTNENIKLLSQEAIDRSHIKIGDGIFYLTPEEVKNLNLSKEERKLIKTLWKASDVESYLPADGGQEPGLFIIYTTNDIRIEDFPQIKRHLLKYKPILLERLAKYEEDYPWFKLHRERNQNIFEDEKIIYSIWPEKNIFGYATDNYYTERNTFTILKRSGIKEDLKYILAILNSALFSFWFEQKVSRRGNKYYLPQNVLEKIPIRRIDFNNPKELKIHDKLVLLVKNIIDSKKSLVTFNQFFLQTRLTRLSENDPLPEIDREAIVKSLPSSSIRTLRTHSEIKYEPKSVKSFYLKGLKQDDTKGLIITSKNKQQIMLTAPRKILEYLKKTLPVYKGKEWQEIINHILLPADLTILEKKKREILSEVTFLRDKITKIQHAIDEIVFELYGITEKEKEEICKISG